MNSNLEFLPLLCWEIVTDVGRFKQFYNSQKIIRERQVYEVKGKIQEIAWVNAPEEFSLFFPELRSFPNFEFRIKLAENQKPILFRHIEQSVSIGQQISIMQGSEKYFYIIGYEEDSVQHLFQISCRYNPFQEDGNVFIVTESYKPDIKPKTLDYYIQKTAKEYAQYAQTT